jgi:hypothetical protein
MTSPIVFLDIDGVVNSLSSTLVYGDAEWPNPVSLGLMARLVHNAEAFVVVSSSWRIGRSPQELRDTFARWSGDGATLASHVIDVTDTGPGPRGAQIARWLAKQPSWRVGACSAAIATASACASTCARCRSSRRATRTRRSSPGTRTTAR